MNTAGRKTMSNLFKFFVVFLRIGAFTFGGGLAMLPLIEREIVDNNGWMTREEFIDVIAVTQCMPGVIAVNTAIYLGYQLFGIWGTIIGALGAILPSFIIMVLAAEFFIAFRDNSIVQAVFMGVRPAIAVLIFSAAVRLGKAVDRTAHNILIALGSLISISLLGIHPIPVIVAAALIGIVKARGYEKNENAD
jgi:chromate transporter